MTRRKVPLWRENGAWKPSQRHLAAIDCVARMYGITLDDIQSKKRPWKYSRPRQVACWMLRRVFSGLSFTMIAEAINIGDHTTVIYAKDCVERRRREDVEYREQTDAVLAAVHAVLDGAAQVIEPLKHVQARLDAEREAASRIPKPVLVDRAPAKLTDPVAAAIQADIDAEADALLARDGVEHAPDGRGGVVCRMSAAEIADRREQVERARAARQAYWRAREARATGQVPGFPA